MSRKINLPGYNTLVENVAFAKDGAGIEISPLIPIKIPSSEVLSFSKYSVPTKENVCNYIHNSIKNLDSGFVSRDDADRQWYEILSKTTKALPGDHVFALSQGNDGVMGHLMNHCDLENHLPEREYLVALTYSVPSPTLNDLKEAYVSHGNYLMNMALDGQVKGKNIFRILLNKDGSVISKSDLEHLLDSGVRDSDVLNVECDRDKYTDASKNIQFIHSILNSLDNMKYLKDDSNNFLMDSVLRSWASYMQCAMAKEHFSNGLSGIFDNLFSRNDNSEDKDNDSDEEVDDFIKGILGRH